MPDKPDKPTIPDDPGYDIVMRIPALCLWLALLVMVIGCDRKSAPAAPASATKSDGSAVAVAVDHPIRIVFLGDSLTAGYGLSQDEAYPAVLERRLLADGKSVKVVNAGVSGDTTAGGLSRLDWLLQQKPEVVVVALGGNDGLRGQSVEAAESNLRHIIEKCKASSAKVLLLGIKIPPNYGLEYASKFARIYEKIAKDQEVALVPYMLEGVGGVASMNQGDGIHPTAQGQERVADNVMPTLKDVLASVKPTS